MAVNIQMNILKSDNNYEILNPSTTASITSYSNTNTSSIITGNNVQSAIDQLFTSVSNGKSSIASAITDKGVSTSGNDSFSKMAENIRSLQIKQQTDFRVQSFTLSGLTYAYDGTLNFNLVLNDLWGFLVYYDTPILNVGGLPVYLMTWGYYYQWTMNGSNYMKVIENEYNNSSYSWNYNNKVLSFKKTGSYPYLLSSYSIIAWGPS